MIHNGHCFHCGTAIPAGDTTCPEDTCQTRENEMPIWPWSRCRNCQEWLVRIADWRQLLWEYWALPLGVFLALFGFLIFSGIIKYSGFVIIGGWVLTRMSVGLIRSTRVKLANQENIRNQTQQDFDAGIIADNADGRKRLDDENDRVKARDWQFFGALHLRSTVQWGIVCILLLFATFWGPGKLFTWSPKIWAQATYRNVAASSPAKDLAGNLKSQLRWDEYKVRRLYNKLAGERLISWDQFQQLRQHPKFDPDLLLDELGKTDLMEDALFYQLTNSMTLAVKPAVAPIPQQAEKGWLQSYRESLWVTILLSFWIVLLICVIHLVYGAFSIAAYFGWYAGDELRDQMRHNMERILEKHGVRQPRPPAAPAVAAAAVAGAEAAQVAAPGRGAEEVSSFVGRHMFAFALLSGILELVVDKLLGRLKGS